jgi:hypothetical protein
MKPGSSRVKRWNKWFDKINHQIADLVLNEQQRKQFWRIMAQSPVANVPSPLVGYLMFALTNEIVIEIRRLCDRQTFGKNGRLNKKSVCSLVALLQEFETYPDYFTRRRYVGMSREPRRTDYSHFPRGVAFSVPMDRHDHWKFRNKAFDHYAGKGVDRLTAADIAADRDKLEKEVLKVQIFANKFVAHNDLRQKARRSLPYAELDRSISAIAKTAEKYYLLLSRSQFMYEPHEPAITGMFARPWITTAKRRAKLEEEFRQMPKLTKKN